MDIGVPREQRDYEKRVGLTPAGCRAIVSEGHRVYVETGAGAGAGFSDPDYQQAGAEIVFSSLEAFQRADLVLKVTPLLPREYQLLRNSQVVFGFQHLAAAPYELIEVFAEKRITAIAFETIQRADGSLPILIPMSQVAGRMAPQIAARYLESTGGGHGILLGGVPGVPPANVCILGAGVVGRNAARAFLGIGAHVTVLDQDPRRLEALQDQIGPYLVTLPADEDSLARGVAAADVLVGAVLIPGARAPIVVSREMVRSMRPRSVVIDFSIDQGGCVETSRPTTPGDPAFLEEEVFHYCVPNVPGVVARTATYALGNSILEFVRVIASLGVNEALARDSALLAGVNVFEGELVNSRVAAAFGARAREVKDMLGSRRLE